MGIVAASLSVTDSHNTLCNRSCRYLIPFLLIPLPNGITHFATEAVSVHSFIPLLTAKHTLRQKLCQFLATDGYSGYFIPLPTAITHFATEAVSVPHTDGHTSRNYTDGYSGYSLSVTDSHNTLCDEAVSVPHTDGYSGYSLSRYRRRQAVSGSHTDVVTLPVTATAATLLRQKLCQYLIPMGIVASLCPLQTAATRFATEAVSSTSATDGYSGYSLSVTDSHNTLRQAVSVPPADGYSGFSLSVTDGHNFCDRSCVGTSYRWV
ncbi:unnamed protein product [Acanthosepion pharaonis]|uniref:Uncharacterized protein n=1 Tax=Acanthosepion pharaonis TaxID=158019 RepID=A0A812CLQ7_ACAPH|nr:unnamed protein product [Sepia pharaonis]